MIIPINRKSLCINVEIDTRTSSNKCEYILTQNSSEVSDSYDISEYKHFPLRQDLLENSKFISIQDSDSKPMAIFEFDKLSVNEEPIICNKSFCMYIRRSSLMAKHPKIVLVYSKTFKVDGTDIDNAYVLECISNYVKGQGFIVDAFNYIEETKTLDFIINKYGMDAKMSKIFGKRIPDKKYMPLENSNNDINKWNNMEFASYVIYLIREYELFRLIPLLLDSKYCSTAERFNLNNKAILYSEYTEICYREPFLIDDKTFYVLSDFEGKINKIWKWLVDQISEISREVKVEENRNTIIGFPIPTHISFDKNKEYLRLDKRISYDIEDEEKILPEIADKFLGRIKKNRLETKVTLDYNNYYNQFEFIIGDKVILTDAMINRLLSYAIYSVSSLEEQYMLLKKGKDYIDQDSEEFIIDKMKGEL